MQETNRKEKPAPSVAHIVFDLIGILICLVFIPILVLNTVFIVKGSMDDSKPPTAFGLTPVIENGDLHIVKNDKVVLKLDDAGDAFRFIQTPKGMLEFAGIPLLIFVVYDIIRRRLFRTKEEINKDPLPQNVEEFKEDLDNVDLPREVLKKPQIEAQSDIEEYIVHDTFDVSQVEPAPERMAEAYLNEQNYIDIISNDNNAGAAIRFNEPEKPHTTKVKVRVPRKTSGQKVARIKVKVSVY